MLSQPVYVVITPVRDEETWLNFTMESMVAQTLRPAEWIIVDDGSSDGTAAIIQEYAGRYRWIRGLTRPDRGRRLPGAGVVEAFYEGYRSLSCPDWEFLVKLDADLSFAPDFFQLTLAHFSAQPRLGIGGACLYQVADGMPELEEGPRFHVRGATKIYRRECWEAIGGLMVAPGWDVMDEIRANMLGWTTESFDDVSALHHRPTGGAGYWRDMVKRGRGCYVAGYHPLYVAARCLRRLGSRPYLLGSVGMGAGFISAYLGRSGAPRDPNLVRYVHQQQWRRLLGLDTMWR
ncbi:MAG TPA: glycosyltransferase family A protein [Terriglobales bacterium]|nr:glycosyltransferase family A protein [Terriglobales bacterium]